MLYIAIDVETIGPGGPVKAVSFVCMTETFVLLSTCNVAFECVGTNDKDASLALANIENKSIKETLVRNSGFDMSRVLFWIKNHKLLKKLNDISRSYTEAADCLVKWFGEQRAITRRIRLVTDNATTDLGALNKILRSRGAQEFGSVISVSESVEDVAARAHQLYNTSWRTNALLLLYKKIGIEKVHDPETECFSNLRALYEMLPKIKPA